MNHHSLKSAASFLMILSVILSVLVFSANASELPKEDLQATRVLHYSDGSYDVITICQNDPGGHRAFTYGHVTTSHYTSSNVLVWTVKLHGTFSYNGTTSNCVNAYTTVDFYESGWSVISESTSRSGNTAYNAVELGKKILGITYTMEYTMEHVNQSLSCDKNGNLS